MAAMPPPTTDKVWVDAKLVKAFGRPDPEQGLRNAKHLAGQLDKSYPTAAVSLCERLEEMFTVARLGIDGRLAKTLTRSNPVESMISIARATNRNVTRWRDGQMPQLVTAIHQHAHPKPPKTPKLSVPPPKVRSGSSLKIHTDRDTLDHEPNTMLAVAVVRAARAASAI